MGCQLRYGTAGATGGGWASQPGTLQPSYEESWHLARWSYQRRSPEARIDPYGWRSGWTFGFRAGCGMPPGNDGCPPVGDGLSDCDYWGPPIVATGPGTSLHKFLRGRCEDSGGTAVANATVQAFRTSDDAFSGESVSYDDGTYICPATYAAVNHYIVAYKAGSPDTGGTTVNTLVPANIDGT